MISAGGAPTALVTGAAGFVGRRVLDQLARDGIRAISTDRSGTVSLIGDLANPEFTESLPSVDVVIHCAAVQYVSKDLPTLARRDWFERNNVVATTQLARRYAREPGTFIVNIGTSMMYEQTGVPSYSIGSRMLPQGPYSSSKLRAHLAIKQIPNPSATIIPCIVGGAGREGFFRSLIASMQSTGYAVVIGTGEMPTATVHVDDLASLIVLVARRRQTGLFNAAAPQPLSVRQWIDIISRQLGKARPRIISVPLSFAAFAAAISGHRLLAKEQLLMLRYPHVLETRESTDLGWSPRYSNEQVVTEIAQHFIRKGEDARADH